MRVKTNFNKSDSAKMSDKTEESVTIEEASSDLLIKKKNNSKEQEDSNSVELFLGSQNRCFSVFTSSS